MAEESSWAWLEGLASQTVEVGGQVLAAKYQRDNGDTQPPVQQTVTTVPADASDRGAVQTPGVLGSVKLLEPWQKIGLAVAAVLALFLVMGRR